MTCRRRPVQVVRRMELALRRALGRAPPERPLTLWELAATEQTPEPEGERSRAAARRAERCPAAKAQPFSQEKLRVLRRGNLPAHRAAAADNSDRACRRRARAAAQPRRRSSL